MSHVVGVFSIIIVNFMKKLQELLEDDFEDFESQARII